MSTSASVKGDPSMRWTKKQLMAHIKDLTSGNGDAESDKVVRLERELAAAQRTHEVEMNAIMDLRNALEEENTVLKAQHDAVFDGLMLRDEVVVEHQLFKNLLKQFEETRPSSPPPGFTDDALKAALQEAYASSNECAAEAKHLRDQLTARDETILELHAAEKLQAENLMKATAAAEEVSPLRVQLATVTAQFEQQLLASNKKITDMQAQLTEHGDNSEQLEAALLAVAQTDKLVGELQVQLAESSVAAAMREKAIECGQCARLKDDVETAKARIVEMMKDQKKTSGHTAGSRALDRSMRRTKIGRRHPLYGTRR